jgi:hypothetical protein
MKRQFQTEIQHGHTVKWFGDGESWTMFTVISLSFLFGESALEARRKNPELLKQDAYERACQEMQWSYHYSGPGRNFSHGPSMRINQNRVMLIQSGGLDI